MYTGASKDMKAGRDNKKSEAKDRRPRVLFPGARLKPADAAEERSPEPGLVQAI